MPFWVSNDPAIRKRSCSMLMERAKTIHHLLMFLCLMTAGWIMSVGIVNAQSVENTGVVIAGRLDANINSGSVRILKGWIEDADQRGASLFVLELNTSGGRLDETRDLVGAIRGSNVPVVVFVTPSDARAVAAGTFVVVAGHIAAMTPGARIGAVPPSDDWREDFLRTMGSRETRDAATLLRGIASERGRNAEALDRTIFQGISYSAEEAVRLEIVDFSANDVPDLLTKIDGFGVTVAGAERTLITTNAVVEWVETTRVQRFMRWLADPQLLFFMLTFGGFLVLFELLNPGGWAAGATGVVLLLLTFLALGSMPVNWVGVSLIVGGLILIFIEIYSPAWGGFGLAGGISFVLGGFLLFGDSSVPGLPAPEVRVDIRVLALVSVLLAVPLIGLGYSARKSRNIRIVPRNDQIMGQPGVVRKALNPKGTVQVANELWTAESDTGVTIQSGDTVIVSEVEGVTLKVAREASVGSEQAAVIENNRSL